MKNLIRAALAALSIATIPVAYAGTVSNAPSTAQYDSQYGSPSPGWG
jgi:hypothetical protein